MAGRKKRLGFFLEISSSCLTPYFLLTAHQDWRAESSRDLSSLNFYSCFCLWTHFSNRVEVLQSTAKTPNSWILDWPHGKATTRRALSQWFWWEGRVDSCSPKSSLFPQPLGPVWERTAPAHRSQPMEEEKNWNHGKSGKVFMTIIWKRTQKGQKESAKGRPNSPLWEIFSHGIPKHKRKRLKKKNYDFVFLFKHTSERMCSWVSAPRNLQPVGICLNQNYFTCRFY